MCHGPGSLKRMNPDVTSENETDDKERWETRTENNRDVPEVEVIVRSGLEVSEETIKKKI